MKKAKNQKSKFLLAVSAAITVLTEAVADNGSRTTKTITAEHIATTTEHIIIRQSVRVV